MAAHAGVDHTVGQLLRCSPRCARWGFRVLLGLALVGLAGALGGTVREYAAGPALVFAPPAGGPRLAAFLPSRFLTRLRPGMPLRFQVPGHEAREAIIAVVGREILTPADVRSRFGTDLAGRVAGPVILVEAPLGPLFSSPSQQEAFRRDATTTLAFVPLRSRLLLPALLSGLKSAAHRDDV